MTTYEKFIESKTKLASGSVVWSYYLYLTNCEVNPDGTEHYTIENSEEWFSNSFMEQIYVSIDNETIDFDFEYFNSDNSYKQQVCDDYYNGHYQEDDENHLWEFDEELRAQIEQMRIDKDTSISLTFYNSFLNTFTFEDFKTLLYENGIYNDIFADQIDLK